jgi:hypothetical protein
VKQATGQIHHSCQSFGDWVRQSVTPRGHHPDWVHKEERWSLVLPEPAPERRDETSGQLPFARTKRLKFPACDNSQAIRTNRAHFHGNLRTLPPYKHSYTHKRFGIRLNHYDALCIGEYSNIFSIFRLIFLASDPSLPPFVPLFSALSFTFTIS